MELYIYSTLFIFIITISTGIICSIPQLIKFRENIIKWDLRLLYVWFIVGGIMLAVKIIGV